LTAPSTSDLDIARALAGWLEGGAQASDPVSWLMERALRQIIELRRWRETVRDVFDLAHFHETDSLFDGSELAREVVTMIEERHPAYFRADR